MDRLFAILALAATAAAPLAGCRERAEEKQSQPAGEPAAAAPFTFDELQTMFPDSLAGMPRETMVPTPEIPQASAYYQSADATRSGHVVYTLLPDPARTRADWEKRYPGRATIGGRTAYTRTYTLKNDPEAAQGCLAIGDRVGVCVDLMPGAVTDIPGLFAEVPLEALEKRAAAAPAAAKK